MTISSLPAITGLTPFDQQNVCTSVATFEDPVSPEGQAALAAAAEHFYQGSQGSDRRPVLYVRFVNSTTMHICHLANKEMPTRQLFDGLLAYLTERFFINFPDLPATPRRHVHTSTPPVEPERTIPFVRRGGRTFRPGT